MQCLIHQGLFPNKQEINHVNKNKKTVLEYNIHSKKRKSVVYWFELGEIVATFSPLF